MYDKNLVHESDAITTTSTSDANHQHHKTTNIHNIYNVEKRSTSSSRQYLNQQLHDDDAHALSREQLQDDDAHALSREQLRLQCIGVFTSCLYFSINTGYYIPSIQ